MQTSVKAIKELFTHVMHILQLATEGYKLKFILFQLQMKWERVY